MINLSASATTSHRRASRAGEEVPEEAEGGREAVEEDEAGATVSTKPRILHYSARYSVQFAIVYNFQDHEGRPRYSRVGRGRAGW